MAARKNKVTLSEAWRTRIQATAIMNRLMLHVEGKLDLSSSQIKAADILLRKIVPDLAKHELTGSEHAPLELVVRWSGSNL